MKFKMCFSNMNRFPNNSRVCFIGDSLTHNNTALSYIIDYYNKHFKNSNIQFFNCGSAGADAKFGCDIFEEDVLPCKPTHAVITFGINDSARWLLDKPRTKERYDTLVECFNNYKKNIESLCKKVISHNIQPILCTPPPYDEYQSNDETAFKGGFALMVGYADFIRNFAKENDILLCDYHQEISRIIQYDTLYSKDRIHLNPHGYFTMAKIFLKFQGLDITDEYPLPEYFNNWHKLIQPYRTIFAVECMVIHKPFASLEEKITIAKNYVAKRPDGDWFKSITQKYIENKPKQEELFEEICHIYKTEILNKGV